MKRQRIVLTAVGLGLAITAGLALSHRREEDLVLTGIVTANDVIVSSQVGGRVSRLLVTEGSAVTLNQVIATLEPGELQADRAFYARNAEASASQVAASEAALAASIAQQGEAESNRSNTKRILDRDEALLAVGGVTQQEIEAARTAYEVARARATAADREVANKRSAAVAAKRQAAAALAQTSKADVRLRYSEITAPIAGVVDVRAARAGEVVAAGQPIVTLIDPDSLWVRADVEESYIDHIRLGDTLAVRLPSGTTIPGTVVYRGLDADFATQRDVSRMKRDIKAFEIRLRVNNVQRRLAVGMTAYVIVRRGAS